MMPQSLKIPARYLMSGDQVGSGETVVAVSRGARTPAGKVEVTLEKGGRRRTTLWGADTIVNISRRGEPATPVAVKIEALNLILSDLAATALSPGRAALTAHDAALTTNLTALQPGSPRSILAHWRGPRPNRILSP
jgi:hypothetical protein